MIAEAAHRVGMDGLTLRAVAEELGVSVGALYHHVAGKDELLRLAADVSSAVIPFPSDRGQHWAVWLHEWARYIHDAFVAEPGALKQYLDGGIAAELIANRIDVVLGLLVRDGFTVDAAFAAYEAVSAMAMGLAINDVRATEPDLQGRREADRVAAVLAHHGRDDLGQLRALVATTDLGPAVRFDAQVVGVLRSVAVRRGVRWAGVAGALRAAGIIEPT